MVRFLIRWWKREEIWWFCRQNFFYCNDRKHQQIFNIYRVTLYDSINSKLNRKLFEPHTKRCFENMKPTKLLFKTFRKNHNYQAEKIDSFFVVLFIRNRVTACTLIDVFSKNCHYFAVLLLITLTVRVFFFLVNKSYR